MTTGWDEFQELAKADMRKVYSETVVDHATNPRNVSSMEEANGFARITGPCGDTMEIWLKINANKVVAASFWTDGCGPTVACGSIATEMLRGRTVAQVMAMSQDEILKALGGLPEDNRHCALLAANTVKAAVKDYLNTRNEPWKKSYKRHSS